MKTTTHEPVNSCPRELRHVQALARYAYETACAILPNPSLAWTER